jgi:hypothetical protein
MSFIRTAYDEPALGGKAIARDQELLGQVMRYVAVAIGFAALACILGLNLLLLELFGGSRE